MSKATRAAKRSATKEDKAAFRRADAELQAYRSPDGSETDEYLRLNKRVDDLGRKIGKWR